MAPRQHAPLALHGLDPHPLLKSATRITDSCPSSDSTVSDAGAQHFARVLIASAAPSVAATRASTRRDPWPVPKCLPRDARTPSDTTAPRPSTAPPGHDACRPRRCWSLPLEQASALPRLHPQILGRSPHARRAEPRRCVREPVARSAAPNLDGSWCLSCRSLRTRHAGPQLTP
jgi:hypothetical protein